MTSSSFMLLQHTEFRSYDPVKKIRTRGINDPPLFETVLGTILYLFITVPRIFANSLIFAITPLATVPMYLIELCVFLFFSNRYILPLSDNLNFPSGTVQAFSNFFSACGPIDKVGTINMYSNLFLILKLILLYPILSLDRNNYITIGIDQKPDWFRCWNKTQISEVNLLTIINSIDDIKECKNDENTTDLLFKTVLPTTISIIAVVSIPCGYLVSSVFKRHSIENRQKIIDALSIPISNIILWIQTTYRCSIANDENVNTETTHLNESVDPDETSLSVVEIRDHRRSDSFSFRETLLTLFINIRTIFHDQKGEEQSRKSNLIHVVEM